MGGLVSLDPLLPERTVLCVPVILADSAICDGSTLTGNVGERPYQGLHGTPCLCPGGGLLTPIRTVIRLERSQLVIRNPLGRSDLPILQAPAEDPPRLVSCLP